jgi:hypothetical protein
MAAELTAVDYAYLVILKAEDRLISNNEMHELYQVRLKSPDFERLNAYGYVDTMTKPRPYRHIITESGKKALIEPLTIDQGELKEGDRRSAGERQLFWAAMVAQQKLMTRPPVREKGAAAMAGKTADLDGRIRAVYTKLAGAPGEYVNLTEVRPLLDDVSKAELDKALVRMLDAPDVRLEPEPFGHRIGAEQRGAAVHIGGEDRHKLAIGLP